MAKKTIVLYEIDHQTGEIFARIEHPASANLYLVNAKTLEECESELRDQINEILEDDEIKTELLDSTFEFVEDTTQYGHI